MRLASAQNPNDDSCHPRTAGHTHETYYAPQLATGEAAMAGRTTHVWQCGSDGAALGVFDFDVRSGGARLPGVQCAHAQARDVMRICAKGGGRGRAGGGGSPLLYQYPEA